MATALTVSTGTAQAAASCGVQNPGTPTLSGGIHLDGTAKCSVGWFASADELEYESGGVWHAATSGGAPVPPQATPNYGAGVQHATSFSWGGIDQTPYRSYNWKVYVTYRQSSNDAVIASQYSGTLAKTC